MKEETVLKIFVVALLLVIALISTGVGFQLGQLLGG